MAKPTVEFIASKAIKTSESKCYGHEDCSVTDYICAVQTPGGVSHRMTYSVHTSEPTAIYSAARPYCGSRRTLGQHAGAFVGTVTCKRC